MKKRLLLFGMALSLMTISCSKDEVTPNGGGSDVVANQKVDAAIDDVSVIADDQYEVNEGTVDGKGIQDYISVLPDCANISFVGSTGDHKVITITFGSGTTTCLFRGHHLLGQVILTRDVTATFPKTMTVTYNNFYVDGNKLEGTTTWTRFLIDEGTSNMRIKTKLTMTNMTLTTPAGVYTRNGHRIRIMSSGFLTYGNAEDNEFTTYGEFTTVHPNGDEYMSYISESTPLLNKVACGDLLARYPVSGILMLQKHSGIGTPDEETHSIAIDYGTGDCDKLAMMSIDQGTAVQITLGN